MAINGLLQGIDTILVRVSDYEASRSWYTGKLGFAVIHDDPSMKLAVLDASGPTSLTIWQTDGALPGGRENSAFPIFSTPDAEALRNELVSRGIDAGPVSADTGVTYFQFFDPDGNVLEACQVHE